MSEKLNKLLNKPFKMIEKSYMPPTPGIPRPSPIEVLTGPSHAYLQWSDENWSFHGSMVGGNGSSQQNDTSTAIHVT